ncbi:MAG: hypothetical protein J6B92_07515 [Paraprevotella sp.]|nr:hypothetical protein [Paraprevotella sp.]
MMARVPLLTFVFRTIGFLLATETYTQETSKVKVTDTDESRYSRRISL